MPADLGTVPLPGCGRAASAGRPALQGSAAAPEAAQTVQGRERTVRPRQRLAPAQGRRGAAAGHQTGETNFNRSNRNQQR